MQPLLLGGVCNASDYRLGSRSDFLTCVVKGEVQKEQVESNSSVVADTK